MNKIVWTCAIALATLGTLDAHAQTYGELGYTSTMVRDDVFGYTSRFDQKGLRAVLGYELTPNVAVEGIATIGIGTNSLAENGSTVAGTKVKLDNVIGAYIKRKTKLGDKVEVFGRLGIASARSTETKNVDGTISYRGTLLDVGAGLSYYLTPTTSLNVDYMTSIQLFRVSGAVTVGMGYKF